MLKSTNGDTVLAVRSAVICLEVQLVLDVMSGNDGMPNVHAVLYFTIDYDRAHVSECMFCSDGRSSAKSKSLESTNLGACFIQSTCSI